MTRDDWVHLLCAMLIAVPAVVMLVIGTGR